MSDSEEGQQWGLVMPFWIDTEAYSQRDREMFVAGFEFNTVCEMLKNDGEHRATVHRENESRQA